MKEKTLKNLRSEIDALDDKIQLLIASRADLAAQVAKVKKVLMCVPCPNGYLNQSVLAAAKIAKIDNIFKIGGAQAIAAMGLGTEKIPSVDKIFGPGNK